MFGGEGVLVADKLIITRMGKIIKQGRNCSSVHEPICPLMLDCIQLNDLQCLCIFHGLFYVLVSDIHSSTRRKTTGPCCLTVLQDNCQKVIEKYGVGSCGPRGFYGTVDVHLELEKNLAAFMEADAAIIYSFDMASGSSVIPAFANRRDILICDEAVHYPLQNGCNLSRARVETFKHNDMDDLERILQKIETEDRVEKYVRNVK